MIFPELGVVAVALTNDAQGPSLLVQGRLVVRFAAKQGGLPAGRPKPAGHPHSQPAGAR